MGATSNLDRKEKALLYTIGTLVELSEAGFVTGPQPMTASGRETFLALKAEGFTPTDEEINETMAFIQGGGLHQDQ